ncbi:MAG TPA: tripartite tricarboxylate transporter TctB family protein [Burkholderiales bacterium]|nr:tripartite tricarboxylate transporter TctB family protein [Burkholderiales bacterium]
MRITNGKDFWAGLMFVAFGLAFMIVAQNYSMGTAVRMGPAYFPTVLGGMLAVLGGFILFNGFVSKQAHHWKVFPFRGWYFVVGLILGVIAYYTQAFFHGYGVTGEIFHTILSGVAILLLFATFGERSLWIILFSVVIFGYLLKPLGLVISIGALVFVSAWGGHEFKVKEAAILFVALAVFSVASFVHGLGLPMNVWPSLWE